MIARWLLYAGEDPRQLSPVASRQLRLMRYTQWLGFFALCLFLYRAYAQNVSERSTVLLFALILMSVSIVLVSWRPWRALGIHASLFAAWSAMAVGCLTNGGLASFSAGWLVYLPLYAGVMGGLRLVRLWVLVMALSFAALLLAEEQGVVFPNLTPPDSQLWQERIQLMMQGIAVMVSMLGLFGQVTVAEARMSSHIDELHREVQARLAAEQRALDAHARLRAFFTSMSHELRTPLNAIIGFAQLVLKRREREPLSERSQDALQRIESNGKAMLGLVNQLLSLAQSGNQTLHLIHFDLHQLVQELLDAQAPQAGLAFDNQCSSNLWLKSERELIRRIIGQLLENARRFAPQGRVIIRSQLEPDWLCLSVLDSGPGIADAVRQNLFEPYTLGVKTRREQGTGMGLALARMWAECLSGRLTLESTGPQGSCFCLRLPRSVVSATAEQPLAGIAKPT